jgi:hypothetical protein
MSVSFNRSGIPNRDSFFPQILVETKYDAVSNGTLFTEKDKPSLLGYRGRFYHKLRKVKPAFKVELLTKKKHANIE